MVGISAGPLREDSVMTQRLKVGISKVESDINEAMAINTRAQGLVFLVHKERPGFERGGGGPDEADGHGLI